MRSEKNTTMLHAKNPKAPPDHPGRLTRDECYALPSAQRQL
jgi:hypothetical protein